MRTRPASAACLVAVRLTRPRVRRNHPGWQLGLARAARQGKLILFEPDGAAEVRSLQLGVKQIRSGKVATCEIELLEVGPSKIGLFEPHTRKCRVRKDGAGDLG